MAPNCKYRVNVLCADGKVYFVTNNYGFNSVLDYPYRKESADEFVIGIFGDSFALGFVKATMPGAVSTTFSRKCPSCSGKKITVLSFAREGFKQPQQLETLAYFLSIGQNSISSSTSTAHRDPARAGQPTRRHRLLDALLRSNRLLRSMFATALRQKTDRKGLIAYYFWKGVRERMLAADSSDAVCRPGERARRHSAFSLAGRLEAHALKTSLAPRRLRHRRARIHAAAEERNHGGRGHRPASAEWGRSSLLMSRILRGVGIPYLHVLQPNQYFSKKPFNPEEARVAFAWDQWFAEPTATAIIG